MEAFANKKQPPLADRLLLQQEGKCGWCGEKIRPSEMSVDHKFPRCFGGTNNHDNLQVLHRECNIEKGNLIPDDEESFTKAVTTVIHKLQIRGIVSHGIESRNKVVDRLVDVYLALDKEE